MIVNVVCGKSHLLETDMGLYYYLLHFQSVKVLPALIII